MKLLSDQTSFEKERHRSPNYRTQEFTDTQTKTTQLSRAKLTATGDPLVTSKGPPNTEPIKATFRWKTAQTSVTMITFTAADHVKPGIGTKGL